MDNNKKIELVEKRAWAEGWNAAMLYVKKYGTKTVKVPKK